MTKFNLLKSVMMIFYLKFAGLGFVNVYNVVIS
jgi:hypothetical protein